MTLDVLYRDEHLWVVNKPPGLLSQEDRTGDPDVVTLSKRQMDGTSPFVGLVHRLDRPASGVMVLARTTAAARHLSRQFRERAAEKHYFALVEGALSGVGTWTDTIAKVDRQPQRVAPDHPEGKHAEMTWQALARGEGRTLLRVQLTTGRPHQIRLQCAGRGHPVAGDARYGAEEDIGGRHIALHHAIVRVEHPDTRRVEAFAAAPPDWWKAVLTPAMEQVASRILDA